QPRSPAHRLYQASCLASPTRARIAWRCSQRCRSPWLGQWKYRHGLGSGNIVREPDKPVALDAGALGIAAVVHFTQTIAVQHDAIPRMKAGILRTEHP